MGRGRDSCGNDDSEVDVMTLSDKFVFFAQCFGIGLSTGLLIAFAAWSVKKVINVFKVLSDVEKGGNDL